MNNQLDSLQKKLPLPSGWKIQDFILENKKIWPLNLFVAGITAQKENGAQVTGSAADLVDCNSRAYYELLERIAIVENLLSNKKVYDLYDATGRREKEIDKDTLFLQSNHTEWSYAKSNGVAAGRTWMEAAQNASLELEERDRVLRAWYGETSLSRLPTTVSPALKALEQVYEFFVAYFPPPKSSPSRNTVLGLFAFPLSNEYPRINGFGAHFKIEEALKKAERECLQMLGFLFGETWSSEESEFSPSPQFHLSFYNRPEQWLQLKKWLNGSTTLLPEKLLPGSDFSEVTLFADLTPKHLEEEFKVVKAYNPGKIPLTYGYPKELFPEVENQNQLIHPFT